MNHFVVTRKLTMVSEAIGEYTIRNEVVKEMLEEVLAMAKVEDMHLKASFIHDKTLFLILYMDVFSLPITPYEDKKLKEKFEEKVKKSQAERAMESYIKDKENKHGIKIPKKLESKTKGKGRKT